MRFLALILSLIFVSCSSPPKQNPHAWKANVTHNNRTFLNNLPELIEVMAKDDTTMFLLRVRMSHGQDVEEALYSKTGEELVSRSIQANLVVPLSAAKALTCKIKNCDSILCNVHSCAEWNLTTKAKVQDLPYIKYQVLGSSLKLADRQKVDSVIVYTPAGSSNKFNVSSLDENFKEQNSLEQVSQIEYVQKNIFKAYVSSSHINVDKYLNKKSDLASGNQIMIAGKKAIAVANQKNLFQFIDPVSYKPIDFPPNVLGYRECSSREVFTLHKTENGIRFGSCLPPDYASEPKPDWIDASSRKLYFKGVGSEYTLAGYQNTKGEWHCLFATLATGELFNCSVLSTQKDENTFFSSYSAALQSEITAGRLIGQNDLVSRDKEKDKQANLKCIQNAKATNNWKAGDACALALRSAEGYNYLLESPTVDLLTLNKALLEIRYSPLYTQYHWTPLQKKFDTQQAAEEKRTQDEALKAWAAEQEVQKARAKYEALSEAKKRMEEQKNINLACARTAHFCSPVLRSIIEMNERVGRQNGLTYK